MKDKAKEAPASETLPRRGGLHCRVLTPDRGIVYDEFVAMVEVPTVAGRLEIYERFEPAVAPLRIGVVLTHGDDGVTRSLAVHGGYLNMNGRALQILADSAELGDEIDVARAQASLERARETLSRLGSDDPHSVQIEIDRAKLAIARALARLDVAEESPLRA